MLIKTLRLLVRFFENQVFGLPVESPIFCRLLHLLHVQFVVPPTQDRSVVTAPDPSPQIVRFPKLKCQHSFDSSGNSAFADDPICVPFLLTADTNLS